MRAKEFIVEVDIDNRKGWGAVPKNQDVDYFGLQVQMRPSTFLKLALPLPNPPSADDISQHIKNGGAIGAPFLEIMIPDEWDGGDFSQPAAVKGHDGRNRMNAIMAVEGDRPVEVHLFFYGRHREWRARHITPEIADAINIAMIPQGSSAPLKGPLFTS
jgi:hypothetical protein